METTSDPKRRFLNDLDYTELHEIIVDNEMVRTLKEEILKTQIDLISFTLTNEFLIDFIIKNNLSYEIIE